jgi:hypothetical protein
MNLFWAGDNEGEVRQNIIDLLDIGCFDFSVRADTRPDGYKYVIESNVPIGKLGELETKYLNRIAKGYDPMLGSRMPKDKQ